MSKTVLFGYLTTIFQFLQVFGLEVDVTAVLSEVNTIWEAMEILFQLVLGPAIIMFRAVTNTGLAKGLLPVLLGVKK